MKQFEWRWTRLFCVVTESVHEDMVTVLICSLFHNTKLYNNFILRGSWRTSLRISPKGSSEMYRLMCQVSFSSVVTVATMYWTTSSVPDELSHLSWTRQCITYLIRRMSHNYMWDNYIRARWWNKKEACHLPRKCVESMQIRFMSWLKII